MLDSEDHAGNFHALLQFRVDAGDTVLKEYLEIAQHIVICSELLRSKILTEVRAAKFFSVIAAEGTDVDNCPFLSVT